MTPELRGGPNGWKVVDPETNTILRRTRTRVQAETALKQLVEAAKTKSKPKVKR